MTKKWVNGTVRDLTTEEQAEYDARNKAWNDGKFNRKLEALRETRNNLLGKTDWTANSDLTMSSAMTTYRQALRDATTGLDTVEKVEAYEFPEEVTS